MFKKLKSKLPKCLFLTVLALTLLLAAPAGDDILKGGVCQIRVHSCLVFVVCPVGCTCTRIMGPGTSCTTIICCGC